MIFFALVKTYYFTFFPLTNSEIEVFAVKNGKNIMIIYLRGQFRGGLKMK